MHSRSFRALLGTLIPLTALACSLGIEPDNRPPDDRGVLVATFADIASPTWSTDGTELYFIEGMFRIRAVSATGGGANPRLLYASGVSIGDIRAVANKLYASVVTPGPSIAYHIVRIDPGSADVDTVLTYSGFVSSNLFAVSDDERFVAFGDSLFDVVAATQRPLPGGAPWSFSPDGSLLLHDLEPFSQAANFVLIATSDASSQPVSGASNIADRSISRIGAHYWIGNDPAVLRIVVVPDRQELQVSERELRGGTTRDIASLGNGNGEFVFSGAVSRDGGRAVIAMGRLFGWSQLQAIDTQIGSASLVATVSEGSTSVGSLVLSPDATRIAYLVYESGGFKGPPKSVGVYVSGL